MQKIVFFSSIFYNFGNYVSSIAGSLENQSFKLFMLGRQGFISISLLKISTPADTAAVNTSGKITTKMKIFI